MGESTAKIGTRRTNTTLLFKNRISQTILTGEEIKGDDNTYIELNLVDCSTGEVVEIGPESSANVEIVLLKGEFGASESSSNWTTEDFNENIFGDAHVKIDLLTGNVNIKLQNGVATLSNIKLRNGASEFKPPVFALGARAVQRFNGFSIRQAKTNSFTVEIYRKKYFKKYQFPSLSDEVYRLSNIWKGGVVCDRLVKNGINNVEEFLIQLMIDPKGLQSIMKMQGKKFANTVDHARTCRIGQKMFCYTNSKKTSVVFNALGTILGLYHENQYTPVDSLSGNLKAVAEGLFKSALENWKDTVSVNDDNGLSQYFAACEKLGQSSCYTQTYNPLQNLNPSMICSTKDIDRPFCVRDVVMECDPPLLQRGPCCYPETILQDFEKFFAQKRWKKLSCATKLLFLRAQENGHGSSPSVQTNMTLQFKNKISQTILTGEEIKQDGNMYIELNLVNDSTGEVVETGPESSAHVEIVLLKGEFAASEPSSNWTVEEFDENIYRDAQGKISLLTGNVNIKLRNGVAILSNIKLRNGASGFKPPVFALGARALQRFKRVDIREAKTRSFTVEIYRKKYLRKHEFPSLSDEVYRLKNIWRHGDFCKRLNENSIHTVEDFLVQHLIDPKGLQTITKMHGKKFAAALDHARACQIGQKTLCYMDSEKGTRVVFNVLGTILGLYHENHYAPTDSLSENLKAVAEGLFKSARENWKDTVSFNDDNALHQYLTSLRPSSIQHLSYGFENHPNNNNIATRERSGGTFQSFNSSQCYSIGEVDVAELDSFWDDLKNYMMWAVL